MSLNVVMGVSSCSFDRAWPMTFHKSCCHMVKDISHIISLDRFSPKNTASYRMHKSTVDAIFCLCFDLVQIGVVVVVDTVE